MIMHISRFAQIVLLSIVFSSYAYAAQPAKGQTPVSQGTYTGVSAASPAPTQKLLSSQTDIMTKGLEECNKRLDLYSILSVQLGNAPCDSLTPSKYMEILQVRDYADSCRNLLVTAAAKSKYQNADAAVLKVAELCVCRHISENINANFVILGAVSHNHCMEDSSKQMLETAKHNIGFEASEWDKKCKTILPPAYLAAFSDKLKNLSALAANLESQCQKAEICNHSFKDYKAAMAALQKITGDRCKGLLHDALSSSANLRNNVSTSCPDPFYTTLSQQMNTFLSQYLNAVNYCSSKDIVMSERCPWTRTTTIMVHKDMVTFTKDTNITINEHWCQNDADYPWCTQYGTVQIKSEKDFYGLSGSKKNTLTIEACIPESEWSKCKGYTSSGQCIPK